MKTAVQTSENAKPNDRTTRRNSVGGGGVRSCSPVAAFWPAGGLLLLAIGFPVAARGQSSPHIGYLYPAGGQRGTTFEVSVGGQFLDGADGVVFSGEGVTATVLEHVKPLTQQQINRLRQKLQEAQKAFQAENKLSGPRAFGGRNFAGFVEVAKRFGVTAEDLRALAEYRNRRRDPKRQLNPQIAETVTLEITVADDAKLGPREVRLMANGGLSNPTLFQISDRPEYLEQEPNDLSPGAGTAVELPATLNGQIMPGDVDRFAFRARRGQGLVVAVAARQLIPYLADAVPGWFQATAAVYDSAGHELAFADDFRFHPDPVLYFEIPEDGQYWLEIRDAIYRGREDFVYRVAVGELPFITSIFPLGASTGQTSRFELTGWNLKSSQWSLPDTPHVEGTRLMAIGQPSAINPVPLAFDSLPQAFESEPNDEQDQAQRLTVPVTMNGRIDRPGDWDVFAFHASSGDQITVEVQARRLNSPLDSVIELQDAKGRRIAVNDDHEDRGAALTTHQADSYLAVSIPEDGEYFLRLGDVQHQGDAACAYRLRISPPRPDFALRVTPASINVRAGATALIDVYALRRDGFSGEITLHLQDMPWGFTISGGRIPANEDHVRLTLNAPGLARQAPVPLHLVGWAKIDGRTVRREAVAAEDMMQAFAYHHLTPAREGLISVVGARRLRAPIRLAGELPIRLPAGGTVKIEFTLPSTPLLDQIQLVLNDPPEGVSIQDKSVIDTGVAVLISADETVKVGQKGNLIVDAFIERTSPNTGARRRFPVGTLPAVPFEVVPSL